MTARESVSDFLARGGQVERLPIGMCNWDELSQRSKINPDIRPEDRTAKKAREAAMTAPPRSVPATKPQQVFAPPGSAKAKVMARLDAGLDTARAIADATGIGRDLVTRHLHEIRKRGLALSDGVGPAMRWRLASNWRARLAFVQGSKA